MSSARTPQNSDREKLFALMGELRPILHRYCSRLMGSVIEGEDVVQDAIVKALTALEAGHSPPALRPWLFRIAHNRAIDLLRGRAMRAANPTENAGGIADFANPDPAEALMRQEALRTAISRFIELPILQRSAVILKDVLGEPLKDIAALLDISVDAVKGHLARARRHLADINARTGERAVLKPPSPEVIRYTTLFNARDWESLRALLADDVRLYQSLHGLRTGAADVGMFFTIYSRIDALRLAFAWLDGREVIAVFEHPAALKPSHIMWLEWRDGLITFIRDYRYVQYVVTDVEFELL